MVTLISCLKWQIICFILRPNEYGCVRVFAWTMLGSIATLLLPILEKKIIFSDEAHFDLGGYVNKQICHIWGTENSHAYIEKPMQPKRVTVWCGFWSRGIIRPFFFESKQGEVVTSMAIVIGPSWTNFCSQKLKRRILATFGFNRTALRATQPKLHSMFCALFLKIALSAAELMVFGLLGAGIWHRWTIICGLPSKISVKPTSQRQLTL